MGLHRHSIARTGAGTGSLAGGGFDGDLRRLDGPCSDEVIHLRTTLETAEEAIATEDEHALATEGGAR